jgi:hypothetical protein
LRREGATLAKFEREDRAGPALEGQDMFGAMQVFEPAGVRNAGRPKLPIRLMVSRVVVDGHIAVVQIARERTPVAQRVVACLGGHVRRNTHTSHRP